MFPPYALLNRDNDDDSPLLYRDDGDDSVLLGRDDHSTTIDEALSTSIPILESAEIDSPRLDAQLLLAWALKIRREDIAREPDKILTERERLIIEKAVELRSQHRPLPYITGEAWFYGRRFKVNRAVLIPRPETEMLVDFAKNILPNSPKTQKIADIGTGSGCIAVSIALAIQGAQVVATDISRLALLVAAKNVRRYDINERVELREGDLLSPLVGEMFHLIVSNPPYIPQSDAPNLMPEVRDYEPFLALFGDSVTPEIVRERLFRQAFDQLYPGGFVAVEIGIGQAESAASQANQAGFTDVNRLKDFAGIERVVTGRKSG